MAASPHPIPAEVRHSSWRGPHRFKLAAVCLLLAACVALRLLLPQLVKSYVNRVLNESPGYSGHVDRIHLALWRGSYSIIGLELRQNGSAAKAPLFSAPRTELTVLWSGLLHGAVLAKIKTYHAKLTFSAAGGDQSAQTGKGANWGQLIKKLTPFDIDYVEAIDSQVHYLDRYSNPPVDIYLNQVNGQISNLTNRQIERSGRMATLHGEALAMGQAHFDIDLRLDPFADQPSFTLKARLQDLQAVRMKDFVQAYTLFDPKGGTLDVVVEATAADGQIKGYVKPLFHDLKLLSLKEAPQKDLNPIHLATDAVGSVFNLLLQNQPKQQLATEIPFSGRVGDPSVDIGSAILNLLKNAVVKALTPTFDSAAKADKK